MEKRHQAAKLIVAAVLVVIAVLFLAGIISGGDILYQRIDNSTGAPAARADVLPVAKK